MLHRQREPGESTRHHQGAAAAEGENQPASVSGPDATGKPLPFSQISSSDED